MTADQQNTLNQVTPREPAMILVEPQMPENIGGAARAMWNFGLTKMRLVAPRDGWPSPKAVAMASGAGRLLDNARHFGTTAEAVADLTHVYATTARPRGMTKRVLEPEAAMREAGERIAAGERVGVLFGRERTGLETDDIVRANTIVTVPVNPEFPSLNLAQCVLLIGYEWRRLADAAPRAVASETEMAASAEVERMIDHLVEELDEAGFFFPPEKRDSMLVNLANLFRRAPLTTPEVRTLRGVIRALAVKRRGS
ncbi:RNA methyltransferase [Pikeienuella piscinae]|uniref:RNA methyltransferase n=1 Tax=Pikeienuella piscinae TaxID=2748098 RepID=A0A7L5BSI3_9RHOB|nr:RNA methyltransferase [Pikeienuella piscinae]QIE53975.1 RNA methyltransferase [Pikeienuella piscinae]